MRLKPIGQDVLAHFNYNPTSPRGLNIAGTVLANGYRQVSFKKRFYKAHRIVWALHYGDPGNSLIDHINYDKSDNRIENLRLATHAEQQRNRPAQANSRSGIKGLQWESSTSRWVGQVMRSGRTHRKASKDHAVVEAWLTAKRTELHGEFARG